MSDPVLIIIFLLIGYLTGVAAGTFGIGGGVIFVPALYLLLPFTKIDQTQLSYIVIGTSLFAGSVAAISSGLNHFIAKNINLRKALLLSLGSIISSFASPFFVVDITPFTLKIIFAVIFISVAIKMLVEHKRGVEDIKEKNISDLFLIVIGLAVGIIAAFAGIGGGILYVPVLLYLYNLNIKKAIGTSAIVTAFTMISSTAAYTVIPPGGNLANLQVGYIYLLAGLPLGIAAIFGAYTGVKIAIKSEGELLKKIFSFIIILAVIKILIDF